MLGRASLTRWLARVHAPELVLRARAAAGVPVISVLTYHHVAEPGPDYGFDPDVADATPAQFEAQMQVVARHCTAISIDTLLGGLAGQPLPPNPVLITFDDGYRSNLEVALPILRRLRLPATFFIATRFLDERRLYWWEAIAQLVDRARRAGTTRVALTYPTAREVDLTAAAAHAQLARVVKDTPGLDVDHFVTELARAMGVPWDRALERTLADELIMTWDEVRALADAGMDIESHGHSHRVLDTMSADELHLDLGRSRQLLTTQLGRPVRAIAYPVGRSIVGRPALRDALRAAGYLIGFTNASGVNPVWRGIDPFDVARLATDRSMQAETILAQLALPPLAYTRSTAR